MKNKFEKVSNLIYKFIINIIFFFSPIIILVRLLKKKEDPIRTAKQPLFKKKN